MVVVIGLCGCFTKPDPPGLGGGGSADGSMPGVPPNLAFVTSTPRPLAQVTSLQYADHWCQDAAASAQLEGNYKAWLSTSSEAAQSRFGTARGWVRTDGKPFADSIDDLVTTRRMFHPLRIDENGSDLRTTDPSATYYVATGTMVGGIVDQNCNGLTGLGNMTSGFADATGAAWTDAGSVPCGSSLRIYCLGIDRTSRVDAPTTPGPRIFLSETPVSVGASVSTFDARCSSDAAAASPPLSGQFKALVALAQKSAIERVGARGQMWVRVDGVEATSDFAAMETPVNVTAKGHYLDNVRTWSGAADATSLGTSTCSDWANPSGGSAAIGIADRTSTDAFGTAGTLFGCSFGTVHIYCAEVQQ